MVQCTPYTYGVLTQYFASRETNTDNCRGFDQYIGNHCKDHYSPPGVPKLPELQRDNSCQGMDSLVFTAFLGPPSKQTHHEKWQSK